LILLSIVTCGIYGAYYLYVLGNELNAALGREAVNPVFAIIGMFCAPLLLYYLYQLDMALPEIGARYGLGYQPNFILWLLFTLFCGIGLFIAYYQIVTYMNEICDRSGGRY
jgi:hypothetical protein